MFVYPRPGEDFERMLRRFTHGVNDSGVLAECKRRQAFVPAHEERRAKIRTAMKRRAKRDGGR